MNRVLPCGCWGTIQPCPNCETAEANLAHERAHAGISDPDDCLTWFDMGECGLLEHCCDDDCRSNGCREGR